jgi:hypothetical protein
MTPEQIYDAEIAPALLKIAQRCQELGFPFVACCEWEKAEGQRGHTEFCPATTDIQTRPTSGQLLVHYAARSKGNIDALLMGVMKDSRKYGHSSIYLYQLGVPLTPPANIVHEPQARQKTPDKNSP